MASIRRRSDLRKRLTADAALHQARAPSGALSRKLLAEIEHRAKFAEGKVRHPFFRSLRESL
jgi:hypothetical protein